MQLIGYIRVSRVAGREGDSFISPEVQREKISALASALGHTITDWEVDLDQSGGKIERPAFLAALEAVERGEADGIAVASLDRFARSVTGAAEAMRRLDAVDGVLLSVRENFDTSSSGGKFARTMMLALAELELDRNRESWQTTREHTIDRGVHICRVAPVGYIKREDKRLEPDPKVALVVRELFHRRAQGEPWSALIDFMETCLPREDGKVWTKGTLASILSRRTYLGEARAGSHVNGDAHEPIVSPTEFEAAQLAAERPPRRPNSAMLTGIIKCAACGQTMTRRSDGRRGYENYECNKRHSGGVCPEPSRISTRRADSYVEAALLEWIEREPIVIEATRADALLEDASERVELAARDLTSYRDANVIDIIGIDGYREGLRAKAVALDEARAAFRAAQASVASPLRAVHDLGETWPELTNPEKNRLLAAAIEKVVVRRAHLPGRAPVGDRITIVWHGDVPVAHGEDDVVVTAA